MSNINPYDIFDVALSLLHLEVLRDHGENKDVVCPFCKNKKIGKTNICRSKDGKMINGFHCYACNSGYNQYTLYAEMMGTQPKDGLSATQIARKEIIAYFESGNQNSVIKNEKPTKETIRIKRKPEEIDAVYRALLQELKLEDKHKQDLLRRGLSEDAINFYGYKSIGEDVNTVSICRRLQSKGYNLKGVPGFYKSKNGNYTLAVYKIEGYLCPVLTIDGLISGFQIRVDVPIDGNKYIWLSSTDKQDGASSGSPCSCFLANSKSVVIVDGVLKANIVYELLNRQVNVIGPSGVSNYKNIFPTLKAFRKKGITKIINAYDMDEFEALICRHDNKHCSDCNHYMEYHHCNNCPNKVKKHKMLSEGSCKLQSYAEKLKMEYTRKTWDIDERGVWNEVYKGLDDFIHDS